MWASMSGTACAYATGCAYATAIRDGDHGLRLRHGNRVCAYASNADLGLRLRHGNQGRRAAPIVNQTEDSAIPGLRRTKDAACQSYPRYLHSGGGEEVRAQEPAVRQTFPRKSRRNLGDLRVTSGDDRGGIGIRDVVSLFFGDGTCRSSSVRQRFHVLACSIIAKQK